MDEKDVEYAGFWIRFVAVLIDTALVLAVILPLLALIYGVPYLIETRGSPPGMANTLLSWVFPPVAVILFWLYRQATPGKMMVGVQVVDAETGGPLSLGQSIGRYAAYFLSVIPFCLGFIWAGFDRRKQAWHDKLAGTLVIYTKRTKSGDAG